MSSLYLEIQILEEQRVDREQSKIEKQRFRKQARRSFESKKGSRIRGIQEEGLFAEEKVTKRQS